MKNKTIGKLIVFDGIDGTGKTTCINKVIAYLIGKSFDVAKFSEPSHSKYGMAIRNAMNGSERLSFEDELKLFTNDRKWDVKKNIIPAMKEGMIVLMDRYYFSTAAYQGCRGFLEYEKIIEMNEKFAPVPDLVFFFFADIDKCLDRISKGRNAKSYMEKKNNLILVNDIFKRIHDGMKEKYNSHAIDASESVDGVFDEVKHVIERDICT